MRSIEVHMGVIRDKQGIYSALLQSQESNQQLAICFNSDGKLLVKICTVLDIAGSNDGVKVILRQTDEIEKETTIMLDRIESIYPIHAFL